LAARINAIYRVAKLLPTLPEAPDITGLRRAINEVQGASRNLDQLKSQISNRLDQLNNARDYCTIGSTCTPAEIHALIRQAFDSSSHDLSRNSELAELAQNATLINKKLSTFEQGFISEKGIPGREW
jgi:hypothetical protein